MPTAMSSVVRTGHWSHKDAAHWPVCQVRQAEKDGQIQAGITTYYRAGFKIRAGF